MLSPKGPTFNGRPTFANLMYLKKAQSEKPCMYTILYDQSDPANRLVPDREETPTLKKESRSKLNKDLVRPYEFTKLNSLYEIFKPASQEYHEELPHANERDIKEMNDVFESTESELCKLEKQNNFLKDQLLEVSLKHEVELRVLLNHECVDNSLHDEIEQLKKKSIEIQEGLQARIKILEKDVQSFKNKNMNPLHYSWISKMEKLEDENVSLDFTVQSLIKERDNVKLEYQKLFNSIKKTRSQTQTEMDELIAHVSEKTYAYGAIRAENQNLLFTIYELKTRLENVEKGKSVNTKFDKTNGSQPLLCVTPLHKHVIQKKTDVQKSKENHVVSKPVTLQTSPAKQSRVNSNKNVIAPGMYKVVTTHESQTNEAKHDLSLTGMSAASSVRRPMNRDSHVKNSVLANSKKPAKKVAVYVRKNKQIDITSENVILNKENVIDVDVANASKVPYDSSLEMVQHRELNSIKFNFFLAGGSQEVSSGKNISEFTGFTGDNLSRPANVMSALGVKKFTVIGEESMIPVAVDCISLTGVDSSSLDLRL
ncbi:hypothetical protein Tco_1505011 [Tanacetum coccineum]